MAAYVQTTRITLYRQGLVGAQQLPRRVVEGGTGPAEFAIGVVAGMEAPEAVNLHDWLAFLLKVHDLGPRAEDRPYSEQCRHNASTSMGIHGGDHRFTPCRSAQ